MNEQKQPLISIIIPVYNVERYLPECLDSLLAQTYQNFELLCVNDGSSDSSQSILEQYARKDSRVRVFCKKNGGVSSARNFGLEQAKGEYIGFVDSDDFVLPRFLERMQQAMDAEEAKIAVCGFQKVPENSSLIKKCEDKAQAKPQIVRLEEYSFDHTQCPAACIYVWRVLFQKSIVENLRFDEKIAISEDTLFFFQALLKAGSLVFVPEKLYQYRTVQTSVCNQTFTEKHSATVPTWEIIWNMAGTVHGPVRDSAEQSLVLACAHAYYRMLDAHYPDKKLRKSVVRKVQEHRGAVRRMKITPRWKLWDKTRILCMLYLPAWFNGPVWRAAERLRAKRSGVTECL